MPNAKFWTLLSARPQSVIRNSYLDIDLSLVEMGGVAPPSEAGLQRLHAQAYSVRYFDLSGKTDKTDGSRQTPVSDGTACRRSVYIPKYGAHILYVGRTEGERAVRGLGEGHCRGRDAERRSDRGLHLRNNIGSYLIWDGFVSRPSSACRLSKVPSVKARHPLIRRPRLA